MHETSILDLLRIKYKSYWQFGSNIHSYVYDKRDVFRFPIVNFPWLSRDFPIFHSYGIYISQLVRFARCYTSEFGFHFLKKKSSNHFKIVDTELHWTRRYRWIFKVKSREKISQASENVLELLYAILWNSVQFFCNIVSRLCLKRNHLPSLESWSCLLTEEGQRHSILHLVALESSETLSTSSVWPSEHWEDNRSCVWPF